MKKNEADIYVLDHFEGQLNFLLHLVQKSEIEITDISLKKLIFQFLQNHKMEENHFLDEGAEFIATTSSLVWLKSKRLLPIQEQINETEEEESEFNMAIIPQLIEYCRFKQMAKELSLLEQQQSLHHFRGKESSIVAKKNLGVDHLSLEELALLFQQLVAKTKIPNGWVEDESWKVSDKIRHLRSLLKEKNEIKFESLFSIILSRTELVVTFLAILELMKMGELYVRKHASDINSFLICQKINE